MHFLKMRAVSFIFVVLVGATAYDAVKRQRACQQQEERSQSFMRSCQQVYNADEEHCQRLMEQWEGELHRPEAS